MKVKELLNTLLTMTTNDPKYADYEMIFYVPNLKRQLKPLEISTQDSTSSCALEFETYK